MNTLHEHQLQILERLTSNGALRFNQLLFDGVTSEHMNYHLKKLIAIEYVEKISELYQLTDMGKDFVNSLDDETKLVEKQPKTAVIVNGVRLGSRGKIEFLLNRRLEHPYFGKVGRVGGKVRFGEMLEDAARRELFEETGLTAKSLVLEMIYRKMRKREDGTVVQDVIFYIFHASDLQGELKIRTEFQENFWVTKAEVFNNPAYDPYDDLILDERLDPKPFTIEENINIAEGY